MAEMQSKTMDDLLEERRKLENRVNEIYGIELCIRETVASLQVLAGLLAGINIGVVILTAILLVKLAQAS